MPELARHDWSGLPRPDWLGGGEPGWGGKAPPPAPAAAAVPAPGAAAAPVPGAVVLIVTGGGMFCGVTANVGAPRTSRLMRRRMRFMGCLSLDLTPRQATLVAGADAGGFADNVHIARRRVDIFVLVAWLHREVTCSRRDARDAAPARVVRRACEINQIGRGDL